MSKRKTLLFLSWRDIRAPKMGGAEIYTHEMIKRINKEEFDIVHFSPEFPGCKKEEVIDGIKYLRAGNTLSVILKARKYYRRNIKDIDFVVNQCNTHQFFTPLWVKGEKRVFFIHQLTREIWFYHAKFPLNIIGYTLESLFLKLNRKDKVITVSDSTKNDLLKLGFTDSNISIIPEGLSFTPWKRDNLEKKEPVSTFIYVGRFAKYKGIEDTIIALSKVKERVRDLKLWVVGKPDVRYKDSVLLPLCKKLGLSTEGENQDIEFKGFVTEEEKLELMSKAHLLVFPSIREGWGLTISEAAAVGTPSLVYDAPGTRDAVLDGDAGYIVPISNIEMLYKAMITAVSDNTGYENTRLRAYEFSKTLHWDRTGEVFNEFCKKL